jgi:6-pyruvoyltetrahydropterin/6-carboxytetrahydropterin synthase
MSFKAKLSASFHFDCAHRMPNYPADHPNSRLHGHSYTAKVIVEGEVNPLTGMVLDHGELEKLVKEVETQLDHQYLNDIPGLELPTGEVIARWIWQRLAPRLPQLCEIVVKRDTRAIEVSYRGQSTL